MTNPVGRPSCRNVRSRIQLIVSPAERSTLARVLLTTCSLGAALYLRWLFPWLGAEMPFAFFLPAVLTAAWFGGMGAGLFVTLAAASVRGLELDVSVAPLPSVEKFRVLLFLLDGCLITGLCTGLHRALRRERSASDEAARHFEIMANNAPVLIWSSNTEGRCVFVNRNWRTFTGRSLADQADGTRPGRLHPADVARYHAVAREATSARREYRIEYRMRRADDTYRWVLEHAVPRFDAHDRFEGYIGSCNDVTESRNEREELAFVARVQAGLTETLDLDRCADVLVKAFVPRFADWCSIQLVNDSGDLEAVRTHHVDRSAGEVSNHPVAPRIASARNSLGTRIVTSGEGILVQQDDDALRLAVATDDAHFQRLRSINKLHYLGLPLRARGKVIGVIALATAESGRSLGDEARHLLQKTTGIAGLALENACLYRRTRDALAAEEAALREIERSERRFRFIWEANIFGMGTVSRSGRILTANSALADLLQFSADEIAGGQAVLQARATSASLLADESPEEALRRHGRFGPTEQEFRRADGSTVQVLACGSLLPDSDEYMAFVLDLTARKHAERALDRQRTLLKTIIDAMPAMVAYIGPDERIWLHNEKYEEWLGVAPDAIDGRPIREVVGEVAYLRVAPYLRAAFRGRNMRHETSLRSAERERHLIASYRPDRDRDGNVCGVVVHAYDITERKEMEQALADALTRYRFLADAMPQMIWTARPDGSLDYVNRRWLETTGFTEAASLGLDRWLDAVHFEDRVAMREQWLEAVTQCRPFEHECRLRCGKPVTWRWHLVRALPRRDDQDHLVQWVGSATDIDEQRRAYAELAEARERLNSHAEELDARVRARTATLREANAELEAFTYSVSHDLRTPLQFVRGFAEAIRSDALETLSPANQDYLQRIIRAAMRMDAIIQDLLSYSRLSRSDMQLLELSLDDVVSDVLIHHQSAIKECGATVTVERPLPSVRADRTGLFQALSNLVSNALKFSRRGVAPMVRIHADLNDRGIRLWIEDNGIGIDSRYHERIFQLFERLHGATEYPGTGIGLSLVRKAVNRMGGQCGVDSIADAGSRFWIDFPRSPTPVPHAAS